ncbi:MAG: tetratricopeptide repeat protein [Planctomycetales bacterium]|nr:tetratricopeptide repeat protein [Planctomycetales bacterium]
MQCNGADIDLARQAFYRGDYDSCIELTRAEVENGIWNDVWARQLIEALLVTGRYDDAREVYELVVSKFGTSLPLRMLAADAYRMCGQHQTASTLLDEIPQMVQAARYRFTDRENLLAIGKFSLSIGEDARNVIGYYDTILKRDPKYVDAFIATAELALDKADYQEAVKSLQTAADLRPEDPTIRCMLAKAWAPSDAEQAAEHLTMALELNPLHPESLLLQAENLVNAEDYEEANKVLDQVLAVNATQPIALAMHAAIAHLQGDYAAEREFRKQALSTWGMNPAVDYTAGKILSQHYRFEESIKYQRRALRLNPNFIPARFQLAQDLLRAGATDEGWTLVEQVANDDKYNVVAFNLRTLQDRLAEFATIESDGIIVRMDRRESLIYGSRVVELLNEAKRTLSQKYAVELKLPIAVEIFPQQSDFAIRTFGLPGGAGFLGVCFGSLITANSPASQGEAPANWESVLWHEFCHVVTLQKTNNRMPRWLSEGISVYEELQRDSSWGQRMSPTYKAMLLGEDFVPLSQLSGAFLNPKSPMHLQFAYFESCLAVEYLIEEHGLERLRMLLVDLGIGVPLADAFARRYGDANVLDAQFESFAKERAEALAPSLSFDHEGLPQRASELDLQQWLKEQPDSYFAKVQLTMRLMEAEQWTAALEQAQQLVQLYPDDVQSGGGLQLVARCARELNMEDLEFDTLNTIVSYSGDDLNALTRLMEICEFRQDWRGLQQFANKFLAVQPLVSSAHNAMVLASNQLNRPQDAVPSLRALQEMDPVDPAGLHFQLAVALEAADLKEQARVEALLALEHSPRYRAAQKLLVRVHQLLDPEAQWIVSRPEVGVAPSPEPSKSIKEDN